MSPRVARASADGKEPAPQFNIELEELDVFREELRTWRSVTSVLAAANNTPTSPSSSIQSVKSRSSGPSSQSSVMPYAVVPVMVIEVVLDCSELSANQVLVLNQPQGRRVRIDLSGTTPRDQRRASVEGSRALRKQTIVLERWTLALRPPVPADPPDLPTVYKHCIIVSRHNNTDCNANIAARSSSAHCIR